MNSTKIGIGLMSALILTGTGIALGPQSVQAKVNCNDDGSNCSGGGNFEDGRKGGFGGHFTNDNGDSRFSGGSSAGGGGQINCGDENGNTVCDLKGSIGK